VTENKTKATRSSVAKYIAAIADEERRRDCKALVKLITRITGKPAVMWGPSIVGFGSYHYVYESGREGDAPLVGFSPRKPKLVLYVLSGVEGNEWKSRLAKLEMGAGCLYLKTLEDIDRDVLKKLAMASIAGLRKRYPPA
jgi:hypothetical protein